MKKLAIVWLTSLFLSCAAKQAVKAESHDENYVPVIISGTYNAHNGYDYYCGLKNIDTVVFVVKRGIRAQRGRRVAYIKYNGLHTINKLVNGQDTLAFLYTPRDFNNSFDVTVGSGAPAKMPQTMHTFKSFPYLIESDTVFVYQDK